MTAAVGFRTSVLDHGYVQLVEHWGEDSRIIESARMSTQKSFQGWGQMKCRVCGHEVTPHPDFMRSHAQNPGVWDIPCEKCGGHMELKPGDEKLLRFLYSKGHSTPFEFCGMTVEVQAPIMVFREWHRHRTQSYSEMSARYAPLPQYDYVPSVDRCLRNGGANKQAGSAQGAAELTSDVAERWLGDLANFYDDAERLYDQGLKIGIPKELARLCLPVGRYSRMRASANLRNWLGFLTLRNSSDAQWEIQEYARVVEDLVRELFPRTWALFDEARRS